MSRPLNRAGRVRFVARLLATLPGPDEDPVSTTALAQFFDLDAYQYSNVLWTSLDKLAKNSLVERIAVPGAGVRYWRRTPAGEQHVRDSNATDQAPVRPSAMGLPGMPTPRRDLRAHLTRPTPPPAEGRRA